MKVPKLGPKAFEQCAGFLRVPESKNVLDHTAVHPESYEAARKLLSLCGYEEKDVGSLSELSRRLTEYGPEKAAEACGVGLPTLRDIAGELQKPGRDPRRGGVQSPAAEAGAGRGQKTDLSYHEERRTENVTWCFFDRSSASYH